MGEENEKKGEKSAVKTFEVKLNKWNDIHLRKQDSSLEAFPFTVDEALLMRVEKSSLSYLNSLNNDTPLRIMQTLIGLGLFKQAIPDAEF